MKIEVIKELPWAKVGEVFEFDYADELWYMPTTPVSLSKSGFVKFVEEKKTLKEKIDHFVRGNYAEEVIEICRQHFLEALPEFVDPLAKITEERCRKAILEVE